MKLLNLKAEIKETLEEKKAYYESIGYKCWVEEE